MDDVDDDGVLVGGCGVEHDYSDDGSVGGLGDCGEPGIHSAGLKGGMGQFLSR